MVICPSYLDIANVASIIKPTKINLGAQGFFSGNYQAITGSVSVLALKELGCKYVILGHSEARLAYKLDDMQINHQIRLAAEQGLIPILCIGEDQETRASNQKEMFIKNQLVKGLTNIRLRDNDKLIIAYEPIWAISPNGPAQLDEITRMHTLIRRLLLEILPANRLNKNVAIVYGGSVDANNIKEIMGSAAVDGVLIGKASTDFDSFSSIINY